jgi:hypothetical protein
MTTFVKDEPSDMDDSPEFKKAVKFVIKHQIQTLVGARRVMTWYMYRAGIRKDIGP